MSELNIVLLNVNLDCHPKDLAKDIISLYSKRFYRKMSLLTKEDMATVLKRALESGFLRMPLSSSSLDDLRLRNYKALNKGAVPSLSIRDITTLEEVEGDRVLVIRIYYDYTMTLTLLPGLRKDWSGSSISIDYSSEDTLGDLISRLPFNTKVLYHDTLRRILATHGADKPLKELGIHEVDSDHTLSPDSRVIVHKYDQDDDDDDDEHCDDCGEHCTVCRC